MAYVDNNATLAALTRGASRARPVNVIIRDIWTFVAENDWFVWWERVPTEVNPVDLPSRTGLRPGWGAL